MNPSRSEGICSPRLDDSELLAAARTMERWLASGTSASLGEVLAHSRPAALGPLKALSEVSFIALQVARDAPSLSEAVTSILSRPDFLPELLHLLRRFPGEANLLLPLLNALASVRHLEGDEVSDIRMLLGVIERFPRERLPFRQLDLLHAQLRLGGAEELYERMLRAAQLGCLRRDAEPWLWADQDGYAVTHTIFYLTDFGRRPWPDSLCPSETVERALDCLSQQGMASANTDLLAEYAFARLCLDLRSPRLHSEVAALFDAFHPNGFVEGPSGSSPDREREDAGPERLQFFQNYHTTLIAWQVFQMFAGEKQIPAGKVAPGLRGGTGEANVLQRVESGRARVAGTPLYFPYAVLAGHLGADWVASVSPVDEGSVPGALHDPELILPYVELCFWESRLGSAREQWIAELAPLMDVDPVPMVDNPRFLRVWALAARASGATRFVRELFDELEHRLPHAARIHEAAFDALVALSLLSGLLPSHDPAIASAGERAAARLDRSVARHEATELAALLAAWESPLDGCGRSRHEWSGHFWSMWPRSMPFGWLPPSVDRKLGAVAQFGAIQAALSLSL